MLIAAGDFYRRQILKWFRSLVGLVTALFVCVACDPCTGVRSCSSTGYLAADGQIVQTSTGQGVKGARVDLVRRGGLAVDVDSLSAVTDADGYWRIEFAAQGSGTVTVDAQVTVAGAAQYWVRAIPLVTSTHGGDANILPRWVTEPYFPYYGELFVRGAESQRVGGASIEFTRTGGVPLYGANVSPGPYRAKSDGFGRFPLLSPLGVGVFSPAVGDVIGDLTVVDASGDTSIARDFHVRSSPLYRPPIGIYRVGVGPSLSYDLEFRSRSSNAPAAGVSVSFVQTGGVSITPTSFADISRSDGRFSFRLHALQSGRVDGRVVYAAAPPATPETLIVALNTFKADTGRLFATVPVGAYFPYYGTVRANGIAVSGVKVDVQRVSGVPTSPGVDTVTTASDGRFAIALAPGAIGDVVVDLALRPPLPYQPVTIRGVRLSVALRTVPLISVGTFDLVTGAVSASRSVP